MDPLIKSQLLYQLSYTPGIHKTGIGRGPATIAAKGDLRPACSPLGSMRLAAFRQASRDNMVISLEPLPANGFGQPGGDPREAEHQRQPDELYGDKRQHTAINVRR